MYFKQYLYLALFIIFSIVSGCNSGEEKKVKIETKTKQKVEVKTEIKKINSVCIWERGAVRETPNKKGKYLSAMSLGEKIMWLGKTVIDSLDKNREYYNVELSDGTIGWVSEYVIAVDSKPAVTKEEIPIYRRPDLLTFTESTFNAMELVAVSKKVNDWLEVVGEQKKKKGWISANLVSYSADNIAVGLLATKGLALEDSIKRNERLNAIINNPSFSNSIFIDKLKKMVEQPLDEY